MNTLIGHSGVLWISCNIQVIFIKTQENNVKFNNLLSFSLIKRNTVKNAVGKIMNVAKTFNFKHQNMSFSNHEITCNSCMSKLFLINLIIVSIHIHPYTLRFYCRFVVSINHNPFNSFQIPWHKTIQYLLKCETFTAIYVKLNHR